MVVLMVRKSVFTREDIVQAGYRLVDRSGLENLTARNIAEELGSSTAPVYSNFSNMEELEQALVDEAVRRLLLATRSSQTQDPFLDIGLGILNFTWKHPRWYEALFLGKSPVADPGYQIMKEILGTMAQMEHLAGLDIQEKTIVLKKMAIFTHGMATEICSGRAEDHSREEWLILLDEVGKTIVRDAFERTPRSLQEKELLGSIWECSAHNKPAKGED